MIRAEHLGKHKSASLTGVLLARKGEATAAGFAMSALESYRAMDPARAPGPQFKLVVLVGPGRAVGMAASGKVDGRRWSKLAEWLA